MKGSGVGKEEVSESGHFAVRYGELYTQHHFRVKEIFSHISDAVAKDSTPIKYGDILLAGSGETIDEIGKSAAYLLDKPAYSGGDIVIFRPKKSVDSLFLAYYLNVGHGRKKLRELGQGQSVVHIYKRDIEKMKVALPPLPEQKRIVKVLEAWDRAVEVLRRKIELKKEIKKGLMQELLTGKTRRPGFSGEWEIKKFGELFSNRDERGTEDLPLLSITSKRGVIHQSNSNKKDTSNSDKSRYLRICPGDIGYNTMRMWQGRSALSTIEGLVSPAYTILSPKNCVESRYFSYLFKTPRVVYLFFQKSQGLVSDTWQCRYRDFSIVKYPVPEYKEQKAIADILNDADKEISVLEKKLSLLEDQKKYLLNTLITGMIRTPEYLK